MARESGPTTVKTRVVARRQQVIRLDSKRIAPLSPRDANRMVSALEAAIDEADLLLLSDYGKGVLFGGIAGRAIRLARDRGKPVIVDPERRHYSVYRWRRGVGLDF